MYGENSSAIRKELSTLLRQHRIQQRIGGPGIHTVPVTTTPADRGEIGDGIRRYRQVILGWAWLALEAANPGTAPAASGRRDPIGELLYRLRHALTASTSDLPLTDELTSPLRFDLVECWRRAAFAAALGEHDFAAGVALGQLDRRQCLTLVYDAAEVTHALVVLDQRYENIPGWQRLTGQGYLGRAAATCSAFASYDDLDYTADHLGWRPRPTVVEGPGRPGLAGVVQAQHNLWIHLDRFPTALNLKRVLDSQRDLSHQLARRVATIDPQLAGKWEVRASSYTRLFAEARNLGGLLGGGGEAATDGALTISRLRKLAPGTSIDEHQRCHLDWLFGRIDAKVMAAVEHGITKDLYLAKTRLPAIEDRDGNLVSGPDERFLPITGTARTDLVVLAHTLLMPSPPPRRTTPEAERGRQDLHEAIAHRPGPQPVRLEGP